MWIWLCLFGVVVMLETCMCAFVFFLVCQSFTVFCVCVSDGVFERVSCMCGCRFLIVGVMFSFPLCADGGEPSFGNEKVKVVVSGFDVSVMVLVWITWSMWTAVAFRDSSQQQSIVLDIFPNEHVWAWGSVLIYNGAVGTDSSCMFVCVCWFIRLVKMLFCILYNFQRRMSRLPQRWRTQRNAIRNANCKTSWIIKTLNAHCASGICPVACLSECPRTYLRVRMFVETFCAVGICRVLVFVAKAVVERVVV